MSGLRRISIHESGHAVLATIYGAPYGAGCKRVWCTADRGCAEYFGEEQIPAALHAVFQFSGQSAERLAYGTVLLEPGHTADLKSICRLIGDDNRLWFECRDEADRLARRYWLEIQRVADALLAAGEIDGTDVRRIIDGGHYCLMVRRPPPPVDMLVDGERRTVSRLARRLSHIVAQRRSASLISGSFE